MTTQAQVNRSQRDHEVIAKALIETPYVDIATEYGLTRQRVWQICKGAGLKLPEGKQRRSKGRVIPKTPERCAPGTKICTQCGAAKVFSEFSKGSRESDGLQDNCKACNKAISAAYRAANAETERKRHAEYSKVNRPKINARERKKHQLNPEKRRAISRNSYKKNTAKSLARRKQWAKNNAGWLRAYAAQYRAANPERCRAHDLAYARRLTRALVAWADRKKIDVFYFEAARLTKELGIKHHVDHIVPLQSKFVCGLHCEHNLQILTERENLEKHNKFHT